jgi:hypothetical protein
MAVGAPQRAASNLAERLNRADMKALIRADLLANRRRYEPPSGFPRTVRKAGHVDDNRSIAEEGSSPCSKRSGVFAINLT